MDGKSLREHLESWERQTRRQHPMLAEAPRLPAGTERLWLDFIELHHTRGQGPSRISYRDFEAYQRQHEFKFPAWQIEAIKKADSAWMNHYAEMQKAKRK